MKILSDIITQLFNKKIKKIDTVIQYDSDSIYRIKKNIDANAIKFYFKNFEDINRYECDMAWHHLTLVIRNSAANERNLFREIYEDLFSQLIIKNIFNYHVYIQEIMGLENSKSDLTLYRDFESLAKMLKDYPLNENNYMKSLLHVKNGNYPFTVNYYVDFNLKYLSNSDGSHNFALLYHYCKESGTPVKFDSEVTEIKIDNDVWAKLQAELFLYQINTNDEVFWTFIYKSLKNINHGALDIGTIYKMNNVENILLYFEQSLASSIFARILDKMGVKKFNIYADIFENPTQIVV
jgi:hypothetical protein